MDPLEHSILVVRRRIFLQEWLSVWGWLSLWCCGLAGFLVLADRWLAVATATWLIPAMAAVATAVAPVVAWWRRPNRQATAVMIDQRLGLKDRLGSALFALSIADDPVAKSVVNDARRVAAVLPLASAFPVHGTRVWVCVPLAATLVVSLAAWLPSADLLGLANARSGSTARLDPTATTHQSNRHLDTVSQRVGAGKAGDDFQASGSDPLPPSKTTPPDLTTPEDRQATANELSRQPDQRSSRTQQQEEPPQIRQNTASPTDQPATGPGDAFVQALEKSDFEAARQAVEDLASSIESMPEEERRALNQRLQELAQELDQEAQQPIDQKNPIQTQPSQEEPKAQRLKRRADQPKASPTRQHDARTSQKNPDRDGSSALDQANDATTNPSAPTDPSSSTQKAFENIDRQLVKMLQAARQLRQLRDGQKQTQRTIHDPSKQPVGNPGAGPSRVPWPSGSAPSGPESWPGLDPTVIHARQQAEQAVAQERVPSRYHDTIRQYFHQLPQATKPNTPNPAAR